MTEFNLEDAVSKFVESEDFFEDFKTQIGLIKDPEKKSKFYETLMGYKLSKLKTSEPVSEDRFRPIQVTYMVTGESDTVIDNGSESP